MLLSYNQYRILKIFSLLASDYHSACASCPSSSFCKVFSETGFSKLQNNLRCWIPDVLHSSLLSITDWAATHLRTKSDFRSHQKLTFIWLQNCLLLLHQYMIKYSYSIHCCYLQYTHGQASVHDKVYLHYTHVYLHIYLQYTHGQQVATHSHQEADNHLVVRKFCKSVCCGPASAHDKVYTANMLPIIP